MNEKNIKWIIAGIIVILLITIILLKISDKKVRLNEIKINEEQWNSIVSERNETKDKLVETIKFNDYDLIFDKLENKWFHSLIENNPTRFNPYVEYEDNKKINIKIEEKEITNDLIENNETIQMIIYTETEYYICSLVCTNLPIMNIEYDKKYKIDEEDIANMKLYLFDNRETASTRVIKSDGTIHKRGGTSTTYEKKGYRISLEDDFLRKNNIENNTSLLGMREDDDWILYAAYNDQEKIRNVFSSKIWYDSCASNNEFGIKNGMEYKYIELFLNNKYWGLYALGFPIDKKQLQLSQQDSLFKKFGWEYSENAIKDDTKNLEGYKIELKDRDEDAEWKKIIEYYRNTNQIDNSEQFYKIADIDNLIDIYLYFNFVQGVDNVSEYKIKNLYVSIKEGKLLYTPWDLDNTFGNSWTDIEDNEHKNNANEYYIKATDNVIMKSNFIYKLKLNNDENMRTRIKDRYKELRKKEWSEDNLEKIINKYEKDIYNSGAFLRDRSRWPDGNYNHNSTKLKIFKDYVKNRLKYMDEYIENEE